MSHTQLIGYGRFHLEQFRPGEQFGRFDGSLGRMCIDQPYRQPSFFCNRPYLSDHFWVWIDENTSNARRVFLHQHALVHACSAKQARLIAARPIPMKGDA